MLRLPYATDLHVHLREGAMMEMVTPKIVQGGVRSVFVMVAAYLVALQQPNLVPPITTTDRALEYQGQLQKLAPEVEFLMSLYLCNDITPEEIKKAAKAGVRGVKYYPRGVTTNSGSGVEDYTAFFPVFKEMEKQGLILNIHGEIPSSIEQVQLIINRQNITILNAEEMFLPHLLIIHKNFPNLKIVFEHVSTAAAVKTVAINSNIRYVK